MKFAIMRSSRVNGSDATDTVKLFDANFVVVLSQQNCTGSSTVWSFIEDSQGVRQLWLQEYASDKVFVCGWTVRIERRTACDGCCVDFVVFLLGHVASFWIGMKHDDVMCKWNS